MLCLSLRGGKTGRISYDLPDPWPLTSYPEGSGDMLGVNDVQRSISFYKVFAHVPSSPLPLPGTHLGFLHV